MRFHHSNGLLLFSLALVASGLVGCSGQPETVTAKPDGRVAVQAMQVQPEQVHRRVEVVGTLAGSRAELDLRAVLSKRLRLMGTVLRSRPLEEKIAATQAFAADVAPLFAQGKLRAVVDSEFPLAEIRAAHQRMESNATFGKVVIRVAESV